MISIHPSRPRIRIFYKAGLNRMALLSILYHDTIAPGNDLNTTIKIKKHDGGSCFFINLGSLNNEIYSLRGEILYLLLFKII